MATIDKALVNIQAEKTLPLSLTIPARKQEKLIFVELNDEPRKANVIRDGHLVPSVKPDNQRLDLLLSGLKVRQPTQTPRVLGQSIAPGTKVSVGTEVNLILAPRKDVSLGIFDNVHLAVVENSVEEILGRVEDTPQFRDLVLKYDNVNEVDPGDKEKLTNLMTEVADMPINETKPGEGFSNGFDAMRAVYAFQ